MSEDWYRRLFSMTWIEHVVDALPDGQTEIETAFLVGQMGVDAHSRVLDAAMGTGRHCISLMSRGIRAVGVDLSVPCLRRGRTDAVKVGVPSNFVKGDIRRLPFASGTFTHAICLFTSFGYFRSQREDEAVIAEIARCVRPHGRVALDVVNPVLPIANSDWRTWTGDGAGQAYVLEESRYDALSGRCDSCRRIIRDNAVIGEFAQSIRIYTLVELNQILTEAGFVVTEWRGDLTGSPYCPRTSPRLVILARRRAPSASRS